MEGDFTIIDICESCQLKKEERWLRGLKRQLAKLLYKNLCTMGSNPILSGPAFNDLSKLHKSEHLLSEAAITWLCDGCFAGKGCKTRITNTTGAFTLPFAMSPKFRMIFIILNSTECFTIYLSFHFKDAVTNEVFGDAVTSEK
jgi:hypothetical protein